MTTKMASSLNLAQEEIELNLTSVKQLTGQIPSFGVENARDAICEWELVTTAAHLKATLKSKGFFPIKNSDLKAQLHLTYLNDGEFKLSTYLIASSSKNAEINNTFNRFQLFACKFSLYYPYGNQMLTKRFFATRIFDLNAYHNNSFTFAFPIHFEAVPITVELYQEPLALVHYRSPYQNTVVGKMEKVKDMMEKTDHNNFLFVSPRFDFGSPEQLMYVGFWNSKQPVDADVFGLSANLCILSRIGQQRGAPFSFTVTYTIFSQTEGVNDWVNTVFYNRDENKSNVYSLLALFHQLDPYLADNTLFYKVHIEPHHD